MAALLAVGSAAAATYFHRHAQREVRSGLARLAAARATELAIERLAHDIVSADATRRAFLLTWNSALLTEAKMADDRALAHFGVLRTELERQPDVRTELAPLGRDLTARAQSTARSVDWVRAGQFSRLRDWIERRPAELEADGPLQRLDAIRATEAARGRALREQLDASVVRSERAQWASVAVTSLLCAAVAWLLWEYQRLRGLVVLCAWTRTVQFEGQWLTFEEYLERRFGLRTSHGMRPDQVEQFRTELDRLDRASGDPTS